MKKGDYNMGEMKYVQIPLYKCSGDIAILKKAIKTINKITYDIAIDSSVITITEKTMIDKTVKEKVKRK